MAGASERSGSVCHTFAYSLPAIPPEEQVKHTHQASQTHSHDVNAGHVWYLRACPLVQHLRGGLRAHLRGWLALSHTCTIAQA
eukprot:4131560-Alexandrium_andersonii.AAC.1